MAKLLVCDPVDSNAVAALQQTGVEVVVQDSITLDELAEVIGEYDGMVVRSRTKVREPLLDKATNMKVIIRGGVGLDNIDVEYARGKGIKVLNTPSASSNAVAELAVGLMFALARHISKADASMKAGNWDKKKLKGTELAGKTLGVIGYGRIGRCVAEKARALGMHVVAYDPYIEHEDIIPFEELLKIADYVTLHLPHTEDTHHLLSTGQFAIMKQGAYLVDAARGGIIDEAALYQSLSDGHLAGAALDVYSQEPPQDELLRKLVALPQVVATPHIGAATQESQGRIGGEIVKLVQEHLA
ncbi:MAG: D-2-hydroxyacid dehydrogenase [Anaerolineae bacterium]|nr:D-2-hydroxyacid dehydrogenase [Anaerolineae bacterium]